jgi:hypothetical protein
LVEPEAEVRKKALLGVRERTRTRERWGQGGDKDKMRDGTTRTIACIVSFLVIVIVIVGRIVVIFTSS